MAAASKKIEVADQTTCEEWTEELVTVMMLTPQSNPNSANCNWGQPAMFWGGSGIGKSDHMLQAARRAGMPYEVLYPSTRQPEDFSGVTLPDPNSPEGIAVRCLLPAIRRLNQHGRGLLCIDEATGAPPAVQGAMLSMLLDRLVGDTRLAPEIRILLAGNYVDISAGGFSFTPPIANRLAHFRLGPPSWEHWNAWYMTEEQEIEALPVFNEKMIADGWLGAYPHIKGLISGFLYSQRDALYMQPKARDPKGGFAWASPRTWTKAGRCLATRKILNLPAQLDDIIVASMVGDALAVEFATWRSTSDLPTPEIVLDGKWQPPTNRLDVIYAVVGSLIPYIGMKDGDSRTKEAVRVWNFFGRLIDMNFADIVKVGILPMVNKYNLGVSGNSPPEVINAAGPIMSRIVKTPLAHLGNP
jgi:hypothetical protein